MMYVCSYFHTLMTPSREPVSRKHWEALHSVTSLIQSLWPGDGGSGPARGTSSPDLAAAAAAAAELPRGTSLRSDMTLVPSISRLS